VERREADVLSLSKEMMLKFTVYILKNSSGKIYIGQTSNLEGRLKRHKNDGAYFVRHDETFKVVYTETFDTLLEALRREKQLKGWRRAKKEALIRGDLELLKQL
jgi:putative endonuclease